MTVATIERPTGEQLPNEHHPTRGTNMADRSPQRSSGKKPGKTLKEKRAEKAAKKG